MCAIFGIFNVAQAGQDVRALALQQSKKQRHRGPDWTGVYTAEDGVLVHERLAIVDVESGAQPLSNEDGTKSLAVNGEIYNHKELKLTLLRPYSFKTQSDCEVILPLYEQFGIDFLDRLEGMFAFVLYDANRRIFFAARDHIGIVPLYYGHDEYGRIVFSSELKALDGICTSVKEFPPGHYMEGDAQPIRYYRRSWQSYEAVIESPRSQTEIRNALVDSVKKHLMTDVPYGVLLSGGLDSSLIASITKRFAEKRIEDDQKSPAWWPQLHTFSIGLAGAPDLISARKVADYLQTIHHEFHFTVADGIDALSDVIYHIETFDVTTIRASTPMYLLARKIKAMGIKMVLSGEGADEIFGGYLYFHKAPDARALHEETVRKLDRLHLFDCLRANKAMAAWGVEARVPFLDKIFLDVAMSVDPELKLCRGERAVEKHILRQAFEGYLPNEILWRQKEQFSDGVGYSWIDSLKAYAELKIPDSVFEKAAFRFPVNTPQSKEAYLYRQIFETHFKLSDSIATVPSGPSIACSSPEAYLWDKSFQVNDPSGRSIASIHRSNQRASTEVEELPNV